MDTWIHSIPLAWTFQEFPGRFHVAILHLPIGFLIALLLLDLRSWWGDGRPFQTALAALAWPTCVATIITAGFGWLLAGDGSGYKEEALAWHRWTGVGTALLTIGLAVFIHAAQQRPTWRRLRTCALLLCTAIVGYCGHLGGNLTHGEGFLFAHAPWKSPTTRPANPSTSTDVWDPHAIDALVELRCVECHGPDKHKGDLRLDSLAAMLTGGEQGPALIPGHPENSLLVKLISLPEDHDDIMPSKGNPLTAAEIAQVQAWIKTMPTDPLHSRAP